MRIIEEVGAQMGAHVSLTWQEGGGGEGYSRNSRPINEIAISLSFLSSFRARAPFSSIAAPTAAPPRVVCIL